MKARAIADVCLLVEGGYPYLHGGVSTWTDALIRALPEMSFHVVAFRAAGQERKVKFTPPRNVVGISDVIVDQCALGRAPRRADRAHIEDFGAAMIKILRDPASDWLPGLLASVDARGLRQRGFLDSKAAWSVAAQAYDTLLPGGPFVDFFWTWRFLAQSLLAVATAPLPRARLFHPLSTGYAGLMGACAKARLNAPVLLTEHGIYSNERRIELATARWLHNSRAGGFSLRGRPRELRDAWLAAFAGMSHAAYRAADAIVTQHEGNQAMQLAEGAPPDKLHLIPNGVAARSVAARKSGARRKRVAMIGRVAPIKDTRTFILAVDRLRHLCPEVEALVVGPDDENPAYAAECRALAGQLGLGGALRFLGRVPSIAAIHDEIDLLALTSVSEAQPLALLEAGAAGLPAVTTDVGSCREILEGSRLDPTEGRGGIVAPCGDYEAIARAMAQLLNDDALRASMGKVMRQRISHYYDKRRVDGMYRALYRQLSPVRGR